MKFAALSLVANPPHPVTGVRTGEGERLAQVVRTGVLVEELGYDAFLVGERHGAPFLSSSPAVLLAQVAALTSRIRLLTGVTVLSLHDPVRIAEDFATLDQLSGGRIELVVGKGNHPGQYTLFGLDPDEQWELLAEKYLLLRRLWREEGVTWSGRIRPPLDDVTVLPRTRQADVRIWHGSATSPASVELAAQQGDPLFSANGFFPTQQYQDLIDLYRERWAFHGHAGEPLVASGFPMLLIAKTSQEAVEAFRPYWNSLTSTPHWKHNNSAFQDLDDYVAHGSALIGSPAQVRDKLHRFAKAYGHVLTTVGVEFLPPEQQREQLAWFASDVAPELRAEYPDTLWQERVQA